jgi:hypothetical protein
MLRISLMLKDNGLTFLFRSNNILK